MSGIQLEWCGGVDRMNFGISWVNHNPQSKLHFCRIQYMYVLNDTTTTMTGFTKTCLVNKEDNDRHSTSIPSIVRPEGGWDGSRAPVVGSVRVEVFSTEIDSVTVDQVKESDWVSFDTAVGFVCAFPCEYLNDTGDGWKEDEETDEMDNEGLYRLTNFRFTRSRIGNALATAAAATRSIDADSFKSLFIHCGSQPIQVERNFDYDLYEMTSDDSYLEEFFPRQVVAVAEIITASTVCFDKIYLKGSFGPGCVHFQGQNLSQLLDGVEVLR